MTSKRQLPDWLAAYEKYTHNSESPVSFHIWGGVSAIAAALERKVFMKWGYQSIYPNMYIILIGPSGQSRKSEPINIARMFVERLNVTVLGEDNTQESLIREMKNAATTITDQDTNKITFHSSVSCFLEELSVFTGQQNTQFLAYLTNWYDSRDIWKRTTKHQGTDEILGMYFNMLSATAPDWLPYILPREAIGGGFTSRCIFVVEERKSKIVADPNLVKADKELERRLEIDLEIINTLQGEFEFSVEARQDYVDWYEREEKLAEQGKFAIPSELFSGYNSRRATHIKKIAMAMSASRGNDLIITAKDLRRAKTLLEITEKRMPRVFAGIGRAKYAEETSMVLDYITRCKKVSKSQLLRQFFRNIDDYSLDIIIKVLSSMKLIRVRISQSDVFYELIEDLGKEPG